MKSAKHNETFTSLAMILSAVYLGLATYDHAFLYASIAIGLLWIVSFAVYYLKLIYFVLKYGRDRSEYINPDEMDKITGLPAMAWWLMLIVIGFTMGHPSLNAIVLAIGIVGVITYLLYRHRQD